MQRTSVGNERLRTLYAMMVGIPSQEVNLDAWRRSRTDGKVDDNALFEHKCGTTACAIGWACAYPEFKAAGLKAGEDGEPLVINAGNGYIKAAGWGAVQRFFDLGHMQATDIFGLPWDGPKPGDAEYSLNDKQKVLRRIRLHLLLDGVITEARSEELATQEASYV